MAIFCVLFSPWTVDNNGDPYTILHIHQLVVFTTLLWVWLTLENCILFQKSLNKKWHSYVSLDEGFIQNPGIS